MIYIFLVLLTIFFSTRVDLLYDNITGVLQLPTYYFYTLFYIIFMTFLFSSKTLSLFKKTKYYSSVRTTIYLTALSMCIGAISPYTLNQQDYFSQIHVICCFLSCLSFLVHLFYYFYCIKITNPTFYFRYYSYYQKSIECLIILIVIFGRINGYIEIFYTIIVCITLYILEKNK